MSTERCSPRVSFMELMGTSEIATLLHVSKQRVSALAARPDFPAAVAALAMGKVWRAADVIEWAKDSGREIRS